MDVEEINEKITDNFAIDKLFGVALSESQPGNPVTTHACRRSRYESLINFRLLYHKTSSTSSQNNLLLHYTQNGGTLLANIQNPR